ncbi:hypothetical protein, partial [Streptomyces sp. NPDC003631]
MKKKFLVISLVAITILLCATGGVFVYAQHVEKQEQKQTQQELKEKLSFAKASVDALYGENQTLAKDFSEDDLKSAKNLVEELENGTDKTLLLEKLNQIETMYVGKVAIDSVIK